MVRKLVPTLVRHKSCGVGGPGGRVYNRKGVPESSMTIEKTRGRNRRKVTRRS